MLGRMAQKPVGQLIGEIHNPKLPSIWRPSGARSRWTESIKLIQEAVAEYDVRALKIKVGGLMFMTTDMYAVGPPGRHRADRPAGAEDVRRQDGALCGREQLLYGAGGDSGRQAARSNTSSRYFEEPVMFDHIEEIKQVADALTIPIANGEQDNSFYGFRWLLANDGLEIVQPDNYYFGGLIRSMKVARMAAAYGKSFIPHMSGGGSGLPVQHPHGVLRSQRRGASRIQTSRTHVQVRVQDVAAEGGGGQDQGSHRPGFRRRL